VLGRRWRLLINFFLYVLIICNCLYVLYEQVIEYLTLQQAEPRADLIRRMWRDRMTGTKRKVEVCLAGLLPQLAFRTVRSSCFTAGQSFA